MQDPVRKSRYTHEFMDDNEYFTVSFYPEEYKNGGYVRKVIYMINKDCVDDQVNPNV